MSKQDQLDTALDLFCYCAIIQDCAVCASLQDHAEAMSHLASVPAFWLQHGDRRATGVPIAAFTPLRRQVHLIVADDTYEAFSGIWGL